ncbi:MAG: hypothetical protein OEZ02_08100 [Anaerolineae bacterium]|nr:hypothetical protein [Anaerolineae bacterium]
MSFFVSMELNQLDAVDQKTLDQLVHADSGLYLSLKGSLPGKRGVGIGVYENEFHQRLLTDRAHWDDPTWDMDAKLRLDLALILIAIHKNSRECFTFRAYWIGDEPVEEINLTIDEMAQIVKKNRVKSRTLYTVCDAVKLKELALQKMELKTYENQFLDLYYENKELE